MSLQFIQKFRNALNAHERKIVDTLLTRAGFPEAAELDRPEVDETLYTAIHRILSDAVLAGEAFGREEEQRVAAAAAPDDLESIRRGLVAANAQVLLPSAGNVGGFRVQRRWGDGEIMEVRPAGAGKIQLSWEGERTLPALSYLSALEYLLGFLVGRPCAPRRTCVSLAVWAQMFEALGFHVANEGLSGLRLTPDGYSGPAYALVWPCSPDELKLECWLPSGSPSGPPTEHFGLAREALLSPMRAVSILSGWWNTLQDRGLLTHKPVEPPPR